VITAAAARSATAPGQECGYIPLMIGTLSGLKASASPSERAKSLRRRALFAFRCIPSQTLR